MTVVFILLIITLAALTPARFRWPVAFIYSALVAATLWIEYCHTKS